MAQIVEQIPHLLAMHGIEAGRRFIQKKQRRLVHQRAGDGEQLPHPAGETSRRFVPLPRQIDQLE